MPSNIFPYASAAIMAAEDMLAEGEVIRADAFMATVRHNLGVYAGLNTIQVDYVIREAETRRVIDEAEGLLL